MTRRKLGPSRWWLAGGAGSASTPSPPGSGISEQSLVIESARGLVVSMGGVDAGVVNIVRQAKELTGGEVHLVLVGVSESRIAGVIEDFPQLGVPMLTPCHCSGDVACWLSGEAYRTDFMPAGARRW